MQKEYNPKILRRLQMAELNILKDFDRVCERNGIQYFLDWGCLIGAVRHKGFIPWDDDLDISMTRGEYEKFKKVYMTELSEDYFLATPILHKGYCSIVTKLMRKNTKFVPNFSKEMKCDLGIHIDIFVWDNISDSKLGAMCQIAGTRLVSYLIFLCGSSNPEIQYTGVKKVVLNKICKVLHIILSKIPNSEKGLFRCFEHISKSENSKKTRYMVTFQTPNILKYALKAESLESFEKIEFEDFIAPVPNNYKEHLEQSYGDYMQLPPEDKRENHCADVIDFGGIY